MLQSRSSEKKLVKPPKNGLFGSNLHRKEVIMGHAQEGKLFLAEITKAYHQLSASFFLTKYRMFWLSYESFSILSDVSCQKIVISSENSCVPMANAMWPLHCCQILTNIDNCINKLLIQLSWNQQNSVKATDDWIWNLRAYLNF